MQVIAGAHDRAIYSVDWSRARGNFYARSGEVEGSMPTTSPRSNCNDSNSGSGRVGRGEPICRHGAIATGGADDCIRIFRDRGRLREGGTFTSDYSSASVSASGSKSSCASAFATGPACADSMCHSAANSAGCSGGEEGDSGSDRAATIHDDEEEGWAKGDEGPLFLDVEVFAAHQGDVNCVAWNPVDPALLASAGDDLCVKIWLYEKQHGMG